MGLLVDAFVSALLPPFCFILTGLVGVALWRKRPRLGRGLVAGSLGALWIVSTTAFGTPFLVALGWPAPVDLRAAGEAQAIVVLGGGNRRGAPEYGGVDTVNARTLVRVRHGAWLARKTGLPVLVSGGYPDRGTLSEAEAMKAVLENEFSTPVRWMEAESKNTFENARASAKILRAAGIGKVVLVTDSLHMRRSVQAFAPTGIEVVPAAVNLLNSDLLGLRSFLPGPEGFQTSFYLAHEALGRVWYAVRERVE